MIGELGLLEVGLTFFGGRRRGSDPPQNVLQQKNRQLQTSTLIHPESLFQSHHHLTMAEMTDYRLVLQHR